MGEDQEKNQGKDELSQPPEGGPTHRTSEPRSTNEALNRPGNPGRPLPGLPLPHVAPQEPHLGAQAPQGTKKERGPPAPAAVVASLPQPKGGVWSCSERPRAPGFTQLFSGGSSEFILLRRNIKQLLGKQMLAFGFRGRAGGRPQAGQGRMEVPLQTALKTPPRLSWA